MIELIYAHPYPGRSRANRLLLEAAESVPSVTIRSLYDLYPDFDIDVATEQQRLLRAHTVVWQHPLYWYSVPPLLKLWFDQVLAHGWAYGEGGTALHGKVCQWVVTTGGTPGAFHAEGMHAHGFETFVPPIRQTARFCGMHWQDPVVVHGAHRVSEESLVASARNYRARLEALAQSTKAAEAPLG